MNPLEVIAIIDAAQKLIALGIAEAERARARGEWNQQEREAFDAKLAQVTSQPHWKKKLSGE